MSKNLKSPTRGTLVLTEDSSGVEEDNTDSVNVLLQTPMQFMYSRSYHNAKHRFPHVELYRNEIKGVSEIEKSISGRIFFLRTLTRELTNSREMIFP